MALQGVAHEGFGLAEAVGDGAVEEGDPKVKRAADGGGGLVVVDGAVAGAAQWPTTEAEGGDLKARVSQCPVFHGRLAWQLAPAECRDCLRASIDGDL